MNHTKDCGCKRSGTDPDDLAALVCAALRRAGIQPVVRAHVEVGDNVATAIEVCRLGAGSPPVAVLIASFPCRPIELGVGLKASLEYIEAAR